MIVMSPEWKMPLDAATQTFGVVGVKGSGKTTTAKLLVEQLTIDGAQCVIIDPLGSWFGLKSSADGQAAGLPFTILGGEHGDVPITPESGAMIADLVIDSDSPIVIDLSLMRKAAQRRFMLAFCENLYHRMNGSKIIHLVVDECDLYVPQRVTGDVSALVGAMEDIVRRGRRKGIGVTLISQRTASINKDVLTQIQVFVIHQLTGTTDRKAVQEWVEANGTDEQFAAIKAQVASLDVGQAWVWSPSWLKLFLVTKMNLPITFDSSATPKAGQKQIQPKVLAKVDLDALRQRMAAVIEKSEENDPKALRAKCERLRMECERITNVANDRLAEMERLRDQPAAVITHVPRETINRLQSLEVGISGALSAFLSEIGAAVAELAAHDGPVGLVDNFTGSSGAAWSPSAWKMTASDTATVQSNNGRLSKKPVVKAAPPRASTGPGDPSLTGPQRKIMTVLAVRGARSKRALALESGYSATGGGFNNPLSALRTAGFINRGDPIELTPAGMGALGDYEPLPRGAELVAHWLASPAMGGPAGKLLNAIVDHYPEPVEKEHLAAETGYDPKGGGFNNPLSKLRTLGLVEKGQPVRLTDDFAGAVFG